MAHPKAVPLELGGQTRHLLYDMNALCALRDNGVDAFTLGEEELKDPQGLGLGRTPRGIPRRDRAAGGEVDGLGEPRIVCVRVYQGL